MDEPTQKNRIPGLILFWSGFILGLFLIVGLVWPDLESKFYNFQQLGNILVPISCPPFLTLSHPEQVSIKLTNGAEKAINPLVRATISNAGVLRAEETRAHLEAGETKTVSWQVSDADRDLEYFVFVKIFVLPDYKFTSREGTCGTMILPFRFLSGTTLFILALALVFGGMLAGILLWRSSFQPLIGHKLETYRAMQFIIGVIAVGIYAGYTGNWLMGIVCLVVLVLVLAGIAVLNATR